MTVHDSDIMGVLNPPTTASQAGLQIASVGETPTLTGADLASGDLLKLCKLPGRHLPLDFILEAESLDSGAGVTISVGVLNADETDLVAGTEFIVDSTVAQGGGIARAAQLAGMGLSESNDERIIAAKITTAPGTPVDGAVRGKLFYCANP